MSENIDVIISAAKDTLKGREPIVLLGPNGSGKTRHASDMASWNNADLIGALRNIELPPNLSMQSLQNSSTNLNNMLNQRRTQPWQMSNEIDQLFSKLMAENSKAAIEFRDKFETDKLAIPEETTIMQLSNLWSRFFPGRHINFSDYHPVVNSEHIQPAGEYSAQQMSDGERVALYLAGRVLNSNSKIIIVDEPEIYFHSRLAVRFWNELETIKHDCRFVYITHDLPFALSRRNAIYAIKIPNEPPQVVSLREGIPTDLAKSILSAASFSIYARRIIFCEGTEDESRDYQLYSAWFDSEDTAVIPVGSGKDVVECAKSFSQSNLIAGVEAIGIIDRDYWPDSYLNSLDNSVLTLPVHEVENILCLRGVFTAVAIHIGSSKEEADKLYNSFLERAKENFSGEFLAKQISERFKRRCKHEFQVSINSLELSDNLSELGTQHAHALNPDEWATDPSTLFSEEKRRLENAISGNEDNFLKFLPGKSFFGLAADKLEINKSKYMELICVSLNAENEDPLQKLGEEIESVLIDLLPVRTLEVTS